MVSSRKLSHSLGSIMAGSGHSSVACGEVATQKGKQSCLAQCLKNYQDKSPEEVAAILQQWQEIAKKYTQMINEKGQLIPECQHLFTTVLLNNVFYAAAMKHVPSPSDLDLDLDILSTDQLQSLQRASDYDKNACKAVSILYEKHKKMHDTCNAFKELISLRGEHFVLEQHQQQDMDNGKTSIAETRQFIRDSAALLITLSQ